MDIILETYETQFERKLSENFLRAMALHKIAMPHSIRMEFILYIIVNNLKTCTQKQQK